MYKDLYVCLCICTYICVYRNLYAYVCLCMDTHLAYIFIVISIFPCTFMREFSRLLSRLFFLVSLFWRQLIMRVTSESTRKKFPHLRATWEMLAYDAPATIEVEFMDGRRLRRIIDGYTKAERKEIIDKWRFTASMEPWPEVLAPEPLQSSRQSTSSSSSSSPSEGQSEEKEKKSKVEEGKR
ncbi:hypothetical protein CSUI_005637 [Cystoisospora suis]|uniref:Uncharacterized protein n=1 Tax=Cystoisospora suis TaxID=483139 RepID=A0A2C6KWT9_9APIC|nr:hypothetical protein CSUI_005637 [Cystoisospora suis]